jgi:hypothetical protein
MIPIYNIEDEKILEKVPQFIREYAIICKKYGLRTFAESDCIPVWIGILEDENELAEHIKDLGNLIGHPYL